jgi:hypothetical protein
MNPLLIEALSFFCFSENAQIHCFWMDTKLIKLCVSEPSSEAGEEQIENYALTGTLRTGPELVVTP